MANKRMFSLSVIDTDRFIEMPISSRLLYYELGMRADDDGFVDNVKKIMAFTGLKDDDLKVLISKQFIIPFESGVIVIRHWRLNNLLRADRYKETIYKDEKRQLSVDNNGIYNLGIPNGNQKDTIGLRRIGKDSIDKDSIDCCNNNNINNNNIQREIIKSYEENIGLITPATAELIFDYLKDMDYKLIIEAIKIAALANKRSGRYINGILRDWNKKGYKVLLDLENEKQETNNKKSKKETRGNQREYSEDDLNKLYANLN